MRRLDEELEALKNKLRELMMTMKEYAESKYTVTNEVAIYDKLLSFEESRISHASTVSKVKYLNVDEKYSSVCLLETCHCQFTNFSQIKLCVWIKKSKKGVRLRQSMNNISL